MSEPNELLIIFNSLIVKYGGRHKLAYQIEIEWMKPIKGESPYKWTHESVNYVVQGFHKLSYSRMAQVLKVSTRVIDKKVRELKNSGVIAIDRKPHVHFDVVD